MNNKKDFMEIYDIVGKDDGNLCRRHMTWDFFLTNFQEINPTKYKSFPPHVHTCFELMIPLGERYCCTLCNREITVPCGSFILMQPGQSHSDHLRPDEPFLCIHFNIGYHDSRKNKYQIFVPGLLPDKQIAAVPSEDFIYDLFKLLKKYSEKNIPLYIFDHVFLALFQLFLNAYPPEYILINNAEDNVQNYTYQRIFNYFNECLSNGDFSIEEFCKVLNCSQRTLSRICNEYFFQPPHKAFQSYRLNAALRYLQENPNATVKETAVIFRFPNEFYFSKIFKKHFGFTPSKVKYEQR